MAETAPFSTCPMAETCRGMMEKPGSGAWMFVPGILFIVFGVTIILFPQILAWLIAIAFIVMGVGMLMMVNVMRGMGRRFHDTHH